MHTMRRILGWIKLFALPVRYLSVTHSFERGLAKHMQNLIISGLSSQTYEILRESRLALSRPRLLGLAHVSYFSWSGLCTTRALSSRTRGVSSAGSSQRKKVLPLKRAPTVRVPFSTMSAWPSVLEAKWREAAFQNGLLERMHASGHLSNENESLLFVEQAINSFSKYPLSVSSRVQQLLFFET